MGKKSGIIYADEAKSRFTLWLDSANGEGGNLGEKVFRTTNVNNIDPKYTSCLVFVKQLFVQTDDTQANPICIFNLSSGGLSQSLSMTTAKQRFLVSRLKSVLLDIDTEDPPNMGLKGILYNFDGNCRDNGMYCGNTLMNNEIVISVTNKSGVKYTTDGIYCMELEVQLVCNE